MMRILAGLVLGLSLAVWGSVGVGQTCGNLCDANWWRNSSQEKISEAISSSDVNARDEFGWTALMYAAWFGTAENIRALVELGADVNARDEDGETALMYAAWFGTAENIRALVEAGADVNARGKDGLTALMALEQRFKDANKTDEYWKMRDML